MQLQFYHVIKSIAVATRNFQLKCGDVGPEWKNAMTSRQMLVLICVTLKVLKTRQTIGFSQRSEAISLALIFLSIHMRGSRNFCQGGGGGGVQASLTKKALITFFFCFFFIVLSLFYRRQMVNFKEIYHFSRFQRGSKIFQEGGGVQLFQGGGGGPIAYSL